MRKALGVTVFSGMLGVTLFGILLTPVFFFVIDRMTEIQLFSSSRLARWGNRGIDILTLRPIRQLASAGWHRTRLFLFRPSLPPRTNDHGLMTKD